MTNHVQTQDLEDISDALNEQANLTRSKRHSAILGLLFVMVVAILPAKHQLTPTPTPTSPSPMTNSISPQAAVTSAFDLEV